jgi:hypothetical protein
MSAYIDTGIVITGEWCHEVFASYYSPTNTSANNNTSSYLGRGLQYFLGFHHGNDHCDGWISMADSHYLSQLLHVHNMHMVFLGCPMDEKVANNIRILLEDVIRSEDTNDNDEDRVVAIEKVNECFYFHFQQHAVSNIYTVTLGGFNCI